MCGLIGWSILPRASDQVWTESAVISTIFGMGAWWSTRTRPNDPRLRILIPLCLLAVYALGQGILSLLIPIDQISNLSLLPISFQPAASMWVAVKIFAIAVLGAILLTLPLGTLGRVLWGFMGLGGIFAVLGISRYALQPAYPQLFALFLPPDLQTGVGFGTYLNQNHFALLMLMVLGPSAAIAVCGHPSGPVRLAMLGVSIAAWVALVLTGSRGGIFSSLVTVAVLALVPPRRGVRGNLPEERGDTPNNISIGRIAAVICILAALFVGSTIIGGERVTERFEELDQQLVGKSAPSTYKRTEVWKATVEMIQEYPLFGVGFGGFQIAISNFIDIAGESVPKQAHNDYLELLASGGVAGAVIAAWFIVRLMRGGSLYFNMRRQGRSTALHIGAVAGIAGVAAHSLVDFGLQILANSVCFAVLVVFALRGSDDPRSVLLRPQLALGRYRFVPTVLLICIAGVAVWYGMAVYSRVSSVSGAREDFLKTTLYRVPFDADFFVAQAKISTSIGDHHGALSSLQEAARLRPYDFGIWFDLATVSETLGRGHDGLAYIRRAVELAPNYGGPRFSYGMSLVGSGETDEGFSQLRLAGERDPIYFERAVQLAASLTGADPAAMTKLLLPSRPSEWDALSFYLLNNGDFSGLRTLNCSDLSPAGRDRLASELLERRRFSLSYRFSNRCPDESVLNGEQAILLDSHIRDAAGAGWKIQTDSRYTIVSEEAGEESKYGSSIRIDFQGEESSISILSQTVPIKQGRRYRLGFSYRTIDMVTGGLPVIQIVLKSVSNDKTISEKVLVTQTERQHQTIDFVSEAETDALEIRVSRKPCPESPCPIFGTLLLDGLTLTLL